MRDVNDNSISYNRHAEAGIYMGVVGFVKGANQAATVLTAMIGAMEPTMDLAETTALATEWLNNPYEPMRLNGLSYTYSEMDNDMYLLGFAVVGE